MTVLVFLVTRAERDKEWIVKCYNQSMSSQTQFYRLSTLFVTPDPEFAVLCFFLLGSKKVVLFDCNLESPD